MTITMQPQQYRLPMLEITEAEIKIQQQLLMDTIADPAVDPITFLTEGLATCQVQLRKLMAVLESARSIEVDLVRNDEIF